MMITFSDEDRQRAFDLISDHFYNHNFGQMSKSDLDLLMFHIYITRLMEEARDSNGNIDYRKCSDYVISKQLGITQQRVRNLKVKERLVYESEYDWEAEFKNVLQNARYDETSRKIIISIPDPNLYLEIQNYLEEQGGYIEKQLNSKLLQIRVEYFLQLAIHQEPVENQERIERTIRQQLNQNNEDEDITGITLSKALDTTEQIVDLLSTIMTLVEPSNYLFAALRTLLTRK